MASQSDGQKIPLKISPCTLEKNGDITLASSPPDFEVMLNPASYSHAYEIKASESKAFGASSAETKFDKVPPEKVSFDIVIDGTGAVQPPTGKPPFPDVKTQIKHLVSIVYAYVGAEHSPNYVRLLWGTLIFFGTLTTMSSEYTLFKPSGAPIRAKVKLAFKGFQSASESSLKANLSSPDLDHVVEVKAGDTLPLLCHRVYKDSGYYPAIAKINDLVNFRNLVPGTRLRFPPLR